MSETRDWILFTGSPASGVGKGCAAAMLARGMSRTGRKVDYRKIEPCLQGEIASMPNTEFGEILVSTSGVAFDGDTARASFYIPGFELQDHSDISVGRLLAQSLPRLHLSRATAPRLIESLSAEFSGWPGAECRIIEIGGTSGEYENLLALRSLMHAFGTPRLHVHITSLVRLPCGRVTSKPSQLGVEFLGHHPDLIFVRGGESSALRASAGQSVVIQVGEDSWPERAWQEAIWRDSAQLLSQLGWPPPQPDPIFLREAESNKPLAIRIVTDRAGLDGYGSLLRRLSAWSNGRIRILQPDDRELPVGVVRIGEAEVPLASSPLMLEIVPCEHNCAPRDPAARPDWLGTTDHPVGPVWNFICDVMRTGRTSVAMPYTIAPFAARYLQASIGGKLRDHSLLDPLIERSLPAVTELRKIRVLDVGCGGGRWAAKLVESGARVVGVEPAAPMAEAARQRQLSNFRIIESQIEEAELPGQFDVALAICSLDHVSDLPGALSKISCSLVPSGRLIITTEHPLRTAPLAGPRWSSDGAGRVRDYGTDGFRCFQWFDRPELVPVYHRTFGSWVENLTAMGFRLLTVCEPLSGIDNDAGNPRFWLLLAEKAGASNRVVTIDGPAGSGKSTLALALAKKLNWNWLDTGMMMRAFAVRHLREPDRSRPVSVTESGAWLLADKELGTELEDEATIAACRVVANHPGDAREMESLLINSMKKPVVLAGRALGRTLRPAIRFWVETPLAVRAMRRGTSPEILELRDEEDRRCGRLLAPDLAAITLVGTRPIDDLIAQMESVCGTCPPAVKPCQLE